MDSIPYSELRAHLAETLKKLEVRDEPVFISRRGEPAAVLMSVAQYVRLRGGPKDFYASMMAWRERYAAELEEEAREGPYVDPFADVRDRSPARPVTWTDDIAEDDRP
jgi:prevent-host-death family protein